MESVQTLQSLGAIFSSPSLEKIPVPPLVICAFLYFKQPLNRGTIQKVLFERLLEESSFRSTLVKEGNQYKLKAMAKESVPLEKMVIEVTDVKSSGDLNKFVSDKNKVPMGVDMPMWRAYILNSMADGRSCLLFTIDHVIADGVGLVEALFSILDNDASNAIKPVPAGSTTRRLRTQNASSVSSCFAGIRSCLGACFNVSIGDQLPGDTKTRLKVRDHRNVKGTGKSLAKSPSVDISRLKEVKDVVPGATINDVLMTVLTVCLRMYYEKYEPEALKEGCLGPPKIRGNFPISLRDIDKKYENALCQNAFSQGMIRFPVHLKDPMVILLNIKAQIDAVKISPEPIMRDRLVTMLADTLLPRCPVLTANLLMDQFGKITATLSNVLGPTKQASFAGQPIEDMSFYVLMPLGLYFGLLTYNGRCTASVCVDDTTEEFEATNLAELFPAAFESVYRAAKGL